MKWSRLSLWLCMAVVVAIRLFIAPFEGILTWDVFGYYLYLPAWFIHGDLSLNNIDWVNGIIDTYNTTGTFYQGVQLESGSWVMRYPSGMALLNAPFFFLAHLLAEPLGYAADGFSTPYQAAWSIGSLCYTLWGMVLSRKLLLKYFDDGVTAIVLVLIFLGTNYVQMATYGNPLPHIVLYTAFVLVLLQLHSWKEKVSLRSAFIVGVVIGIMGILRPNEIVILLLPLFWHMSGFIRDRLRYYWRNRLAILVLALGFTLGLAPQLIYWKYVTGQWLYYSYQDPGVGFDFLHPHTWEFLFSYRKGWLVYSPVIIFSLIGFILLAKRRPRLFIPFSIYFLINLYIVSSWSVWWYAGGSYSSRSMIASLVIMALPLGEWIVWLKSKSKVLWNGFLYIGVFLIVLNLFQFWQFRNGVIDGERMTKAYYWRVFARTEVPEGARETLMVERQTTAYETMPADRSGFDSSIMYQIDLQNLDKWQTSEVAGRMALQLDSSVIYSPAFQVPMKEITQGEYAWIRIQADVFVADSLSDEPPLMVAHFVHKDQFRQEEKPYKYVSSENQIASFKKGEWQPIEIQYMTPEYRSEEDALKTYFWYRGKSPVYISNFKVTRFTPKP